MSSSLQIAESIKDADVVIGAVLIPGARAPKLITRDMLARHEGRLRVLRRRDRPGRLRRDVTRDDAQRARLRGRGRHALLRREHARRRADHRDEGADERDAAVRRGDRRPRAARGGRAGSIARARRQRRRRQDHVRGGRRGARPRLHAARRRPAAALRSSSRPRPSGAAGFGFFAGESFTTSHVTPAASEITAVQKRAMPRRPRTVVIPRLRIAAWLAHA